MRYSRARRRQCAGHAGSVDRSLMHRHLFPGSRISKASPLILTPAYVHRHCQYDEKHHSLGPQMNPPMAAATHCCYCQWCHLKPGSMLFLRQQKHARGVFDVKLLHSRQALALLYQGGARRRNLCVENAREHLGQQGCIPQAARRQRYKALPYQLRCRELMQSQ